MKVVQVPFGFHPDPVGGTELYVEALAQHLVDRGVHSVIAAPGEKDQRYSHKGLTVYRFSSAPLQGVEELYDEGDPHAAEAFERLLEREAPDLVHLHALTPAVSLRLIHRVKQRGLPVLFTYHTPMVTCQRGTLLRWGKEVCDGKLRLSLCTRCTLQGQGLPRGAAALMGRFPVAWGQALGQARRAGSLWTALRMRHLVWTHHQALRQWFNEVDHFVAVSEWVRRLLLENGVPLQKITLSRQGLVQRIPPQATWAKDSSPSGSPIRAAFFGRMDPVKGVSILIEALRRQPNLLVQLDLFGVVQSSGDQAYQSRMKALARDDPRIHFQDPVSAEEVLERMKEYHFVVIPSQGMESGPLVALEAFAAGVPVVGSDLGGLSELIQHELNGLLVPAQSIAAWMKALERISQDHAFRHRLSKAIRKPRTMEEVAREMEDLYKRVLKKPRA